MDYDQMGIADLLADESFINYCKKSSPEDVAFWENYTSQHPDRLIVVSQAKEKFIQLFNVLAEADLHEQETKLKKSLSALQSREPVPVKGLRSTWVNQNLSLVLKFTAAAAVLLIAILFTVNYLNSGPKKGLKTFVAAYGERKTIQLPDGSVVTLNAGSKISINENFGGSTRDIYLEGEAFFDVNHAANFPFIVHTPAMDVKAVGTAFNVKAYLNETITEASLIRGLVEITLKEGNNRIMLLYPNQKVKWQHAATAAGNNADQGNKKDVLNGTDALMKKLVITEEGDIKEIAWKDNKLIFEDELFADIAILLERWYGVKIEFKDDMIRYYRFTGIFEKEDLNTVLEFLKESRRFNYEVEPGDPLKVNLSK